ncbi:MAG: sigma 54-interacting transcriptional regulator, partial [Bryobacteraceae bacterium]
HYTSLRARRPFVALNCAALPENLLESELFGIEKGVATGVQQRAGRFQAATGGTLFLDEVADLSLNAQAKILRVLQERVVERVGSRTPVPVDVRVISATNKDLESEIRNGRFREDLYYRLKVIHIHMPALREIREDIPLLANHLLAQCCRGQGKQQLQFSSAVMRRFVEASWPGNVRQLQNEIWRLAACARRDVITEEDWLEGLPESAVAHVSKSHRLRDLVEDVERRTIREALELTANNQQRAARLLGMSRQGLINKMKRYGLRSGPA